MTDLPTIKDSGSRTEFPTGAFRDAQTGKGAYHQLPFFALDAIAKLTEAGTAKYGNAQDGQPNWALGIPTHRFADSAMRHLCKYLRGDRDEGHLVAAAWNLLHLIETEERVKLGVLPEYLLTVPNPQASKTTCKATPAPICECEVYQTCFACSTPNKEADLIKENRDSEVLQSLCRLLATKEVK